MIMRERRTWRLCAARDTGDCPSSVPLPLTPAAPRTRDREDYNILGKLRPGVTLRQAQAEMDAITARLRSDYPDLPVYQVRTMEQFVQQSLARRRFSTLLLGVFAGLALCLAAIGVYGIMAYLVSQGAHEIGIRMALGATRGRILRLVLFQGMGLALWGVAVGLAGAYLFSRFMKSLLFGITATDPVTFLLIPGLLLIVALLACFVPAQRATGVDPIASLRCE